MRTTDPGFCHQTAFSAWSISLGLATHPPSPGAGLAGRGEPHFKCQRAGGCSWDVKEELGAEGCLPQTCWVGSGCTPSVKGLSARIKGLSYY